MKSRYKDRFKNKNEVDDYLQLYADKASYASLLWSIEKDALTGIVSRLKQEGLGNRYLDFAVGTGRILKHLESYFDESEGIDISPEMVDISRRRVASSIVRCADISQEVAPKEGYDLVTAFRFFLNAEPELRASIMESLSSRIRDENSIFISNNHGRLAGIRLIRHLLQEFEFRILGKPRAQVFLKDLEFEEVFNCHGWRVDQKFGYGILSGRLYYLLGYKVAKFIETTFAGSSIATLIGTHRIYVYRRKVSQ